jgi:hypothetical protein
MFTVSKSLSTEGGSVLVGRSHRSRLQGAQIGCFRHSGVRRSRAINVYVGHMIIVQSLTSLMSGRGPVRNKKPRRKCQRKPVKQVRAKSIYVLKESGTETHKISIKIGTTERRKSSVCPVSNVQNRSNFPTVKLPGIWAFSRRHCHTALVIRRYAFGSLPSWLPYLSNWLCLVGARLHWVRVLSSLGAFWYKYPHVPSPYLCQALWCSPFAPTTRLPCPKYHHEALCYRIRFRSQLDSSQWERK